MNDISEENKRLLAAAFAKLDILAMAIAMGVVMALGLFAVTAILLLQDVAPGQVVGGNLSTLSSYLPGYSVTWLGSVAGLLNGFFLGFVAGAVVGFFWNLAHHITLGIILLRSAVFSD